MSLEKAPTILIVDDDESVPLLIQEFLSDEKLEFVVARDGCEGLEKFWEHHPDLVILDVRMPRMDGLEVCRRIREASDVPIMMLTCLTRESDIARGLEMGADDYVGKPFARCELVARVCAALRRGKHLPRTAPVTQAFRPMPGLRSIPVAERSG